MKILQLCLSDGNGGLELYVTRVIRWLKEENYSFCVAIRPKSFLMQCLDEGAIDYIQLKPVLHLLPIASAMCLTKLIKRESIDVIHIHWAKDLNLAVLAKIFSRRPVRIIYTRHMGISRSKRDIYHTFFYCRVDKFITVTKELYNQAIKNLPLPESKITFFYHGAPSPTQSTVDICTLFLKKAGFNQNSFKIGLFGRIEHLKGQHILIDAVDQLTKQGQDVQGMLIGFAGDEYYLSSLKQKIKEQGLSEKIMFYGFHPNPMAVMNCFDVVLLTTYIETFGLVLIEAMRTGVTVIGTNAGGVPEIIDDEKTGLLFEPGDSLSLVNAIETLIKNPSLSKKLAKAGQKKADDMFAEDKHFRKLKEIYAWNDNVT